MQLNLIPFGKTDRLHSHNHPIQLKSIKETGANKWKTCIKIVYSINFQQWQNRIIIKQNCNILRSFKNVWFLSKWPEKQRRARTHTQTCINNLTKPHPKWRVIANKYNGNHDFWRTMSEGKKETKDSKSLSIYNNNTHNGNKVKRLHLKKSGNQKSQFTINNVCYLSS